MTEREADSRPPTTRLRSRAVAAGELRARAHVRRRRRAPERLATSRRQARARLLAAAIRHHLHWSEFVGGDVVITLPSSWQKKFNASALEVRERMDVPVAQRYIDELVEQFPDFRRAYEPDGLAVDDFDSFPPTVRTLRAFIGSYHELLAAVTDAQLPNPDVRN